MVNKLRKMNMLNSKIKKKKKKKKKSPFMIDADFEGILVPEVF